MKIALGLLLALLPQAGATLPCAEVKDLNERDLTAMKRQLGAKARDARDEVSEPAKAAEISDRRRDLRCIDAALDALRAERALDEAETIQLILSNHLAGGESLDAAGKPGHEVKPAGVILVQLPRPEIYDDLAKRLGRDELAFLKPSEGGSIRFHGSDAEYQEHVKWLKTLFKASLQTASGLRADGARLRALARWGVQTFVILDKTGNRLPVLAPRHQGEILTGAALPKKKP